MKRTLFFFILSLLYLLSSAASTKNPEDNSTSTEATSTKSPPTTSPHGPTTQPTGSTTPALSPEERKFLLCIRVGQADNENKLISYNEILCLAKKHKAIYG